MKVRHILTAVLGSLILTPGGAASAMPGSKADGSGRALASCIREAGARRALEWVCTPAGLTTIGRKGFTTFTAIPPTIAPSWSPPSATGSEGYDGWCESGSLCRRGAGTHAEESKINVAYGDSHGRIGAFDVVRRTAGAWSRTTLIWDNGPGLSFAAFGTPRVSPAEWRWDSPTIHGNRPAPEPPGVNATFTPDDHGRFAMSPQDSFPMPGEGRPAILIPG
jgi:hypothetical protein